MFFRSLPEINRVIPAVTWTIQRYFGIALDSTLEGFALEMTGPTEKLEEFVGVMGSYGEIEVTRSGSVAVSLEPKKLRLSSPVPAAVARTANVSINSTLNSTAMES